MAILKKLQNLPLTTRKAILWSIIIIIGSGLLFWLINNFQKKLADFQGEQFIQELRLPAAEMPKFEMPKFEMPKIEIPEIPEEEPQEVKETIE